jgi:hypothetical protein
MRRDVAGVSPMLIGGRAACTLEDGMMGRLGYATGYAKRV